MALMKIYIYIFTSLILCSSCAKQPDSGDAGAKFIKTFATVAKEDYRLSLLGQGGAFRGSISKFSFRFISNELLDQDQARRMYLQIMDRIVDMINADENLRPYLSHYPFSHNDIDLKISFYQDVSLGLKVAPPYIAFVTSSDNLLFFWTRNECDNSLVDLPTEAYKRAQGIVQHQDALRQVPPGAPWVEKPNVDCGNMSPL